MYCVVNKVGQILFCSNDKSECKEFVKKYKLNDVRITFRY